MVSHVFWLYGYLLPKCRCPVAAGEENDKPTDFLMDMDNDSEDEEWDLDDPQLSDDELVFFNSKNKCKYTIPNKFCDNNSLFLLSCM